MADQHQHARPSPGSQDEHKQGPTSLQGAEASELPDKGRGTPETNFGKEAARRLPQQVGGIIGEEVGERGTPESTQADARGGRKKN